MGQVGTWIWAPLQHCRLQWCPPEMAGLCASPLPLTDTQFPLCERAPPPRLRPRPTEHNRQGLLGSNDDDDAGCSQVLLLSPFELRLAPPIPHEDLTTALPSSSDRSATLAGYLAERVFLLFSCVPSRSSPTVPAVANLVVARHPNALLREAR